MPGNVNGYGLIVKLEGDCFILKSKINNHPISDSKGCTLDSKFNTEAMHEGLEELGKTLQVKIRGELNREYRHSKDFLVLTKDGNEVRITHIYNSRCPLYVPHSMPYKCFLSLFKIPEESKEYSLSGVM